jgi:hypothetical protein
MDCTGTPAAFWLLCMFYVIFLLNHMSSDALGGLTHIEEATLVSRVIFSCFSSSIGGNLSCIKPKAVSPLTVMKKAVLGVVLRKIKVTFSHMYLVLADHTQEVIARSNIHSSKDPDHPNLHAVQVLGRRQRKMHTSNPTLFSESDLTGLDIDPPNLKLPHFSPDELLLGVTFIHGMLDGCKFRASVARKIRDDDAANHQ